MSALKNRPLVLIAVIAALLAVVVLPLSHLGADHDENCPLCNPLGHAALATTVGADLHDPDLSTERYADLGRPSVASPHLHAVSERAPPTSFTI